MLSICIFIESILRDKLKVSIFLQKVFKKKKGLFLQIVILWRTKIAFKI
jgi:hypothetical protein